jgi:hypothetical protein
MFLCVLAVVIVAVAPKAESHGAPLQARILVTAEWDVQTYDADVDLWTVTPRRKAVFFGNRQDGCVTLDMDNRGWMDSKAKLADGTVIDLPRAKETTAIRCFAPGRYDVGLNLYSWRPHGGQSYDKPDVPTRIEITALEPSTHLLFAKDVVLPVESATVNVVSFDLSADGGVTLADPPLEPVTATRAE